MSRLWSLPAGLLAGLGAASLAWANGVGGDHTHEPEAGGGWSSIFTGPLNVLFIILLIALAVVLAMRWFRGPDK